MIRVARLYRFYGRHHVPQLPAPWCYTHGHQYTVEVVATSNPLLDTDLLDQAWKDVIASAGEDGGVVELDILGPENTTVEALAVRWYEALRERVPEVRRVKVWEDDSRWGSYP